MYIYLRGLVIKSSLFMFHKDFGISDFLEFFARKKKLQGNETFFVLIRDINVRGTSYISIISLLYEKCV